MTVEELTLAGVIVSNQDGSRVLHVHAQPGAKRTEWVGLHGDRVKIRLAAPPVDGKANKILVAWIAQFFGVKKNQVSVIRGATSRQKTLLIVS